MLILILLRDINGLIDFVHATVFKRFVLAYSLSLSLSLSLFLSSLAFFLSLSLISFSLSFFLAALLSPSL
jgi:hypothetical protein